MTKELASILRIGELHRLRAEIKEEPKPQPERDWKKYLLTPTPRRKSNINLNFLDV